MDGCSQKMKLNEIVEHEGKCLNMALKCPHKKCMQELRLSNFEFDYSFHGCSSDFEELDFELKLEEKKVAISYIIPSGRQERS